VIVDAVETFFAAGTVLALLAFAVAWLARHARRAADRDRSPHAMAGLYAAAVVLPPVLAAWLVVTALLPLSWLAEEDVRAAHRPSLHAAHLVGELTRTVEPRLTLGVLMLVAVASAVAIWTTVRAHRQLAWAVARLQLSGATPPPANVAFVEAAARRHGLDVGLVHTDHPVSFVWGFRRSKLVMSTGLLATLTPAQLAAVLEHEAAHHARRDNLVRLALTLCAHATLVAPLARRLLRWRNEQVELLCDDVAARRTSPLDVAEALVTVRRQARTAAMPPVVAVSFTPEDDGAVERRVRRLVALCDEPMVASTRSRQSAGRLPLVLASLVGVSVALALWTPLGVHTSLEQLLQAFK